MPNTVSRANSGRTRAERLEALARLGRIGADPGRQLDDGGVQLQLERAGQLCARERLDQVVDRRCEVERLRVEEHRLLLDPDRPRRARAEALLDHARLTPWTGRPAASQA